jgi:hypothetical protein
MGTLRRLGWSRVGVVLAALLLLTLVCTLAPVGAAPALPARPDNAPDGPLPMVIVTLPTRAAAQAIIDAGLDVAAARIVDGKYELDIVLWKPERAFLERGGHKWTVKVADLTDIGILARTSYRNWSDYTSEVDSIANTYPSLAKKITTGYSIENRPIVGLEISSNATSYNGRAEAFICGVHHAREWPAGEYTMNLCWDLVQKYGSDTQVTNALNSTRVVLVPVQNPDGFVYARTVYNMWRKNRRLNSGGSYGVDTNRNYAYWWGGSGSSGTQSSDTYRGTAPFSEPECQAIRDLNLAHNFITMLTNHTYSNLVLWPWGYTSTHPPNNTDLVAMGNAMNDWNGYTAEQSSDLYLASGTTDDWTYGTSVNYGFTFEHGTSFQPSYSVVNTTYTTNYPAFMYLIEKADYYAGVVSGTITNAVTGLPIAATLAITRQYAVPRSNGTYTYQNKNASLYTGNGAYTWHINASKMPRESTDPGYTLTVTAAGYQTATVNVTIGIRSTKTVNVALNPL